MPFLPPNQQRQRTEGTKHYFKIKKSVRKLAVVWAYPRVRSNLGLEGQVFGLEGQVIGLEGQVFDLAPESLLPSLQQTDRSE